MHPMFKYRFFLLAIFLVCNNHVDAQPLFTYGTKAVSKESFLVAYKKNNPTQEQSRQSYQQYLDLYIRYKLKVEEAYAQKLDTLSVLKQEKLQFRNQIIETYLNDGATVKALTKEAFLRAQKDIDLSYVFCGFSNQDTLAAFKKINQAYASLRAGQVFSETALRFSEDPLVNQNLGRIGFITVFSLPYTFESAVYALSTGAYTTILKGKNGYYIFHKHSERPALGQRSIAHILIAFPPTKTSAEKMQTRTRADSIYQLLQNGLSFSVAAKQFSDDNFSYQQGGLIPDMGVGTYEPSFEAAAYNLNRVDSYTKPVETSYGYHIIQLKDSKKIPASMDSVNYLSALEQQVRADSRISVAKEIFIAGVMRKTKYQPLPYSKKSFQQFSDSVYADKQLPKLKDFQTETPLFKVGKQTVLARDWAKHLQVVKKVERKTAPVNYDQLLRQYAEQVSMEYYKAHLEAYDEAFAAQITEFEEGNLLFTIMQQEIWEKASRDEAGMQNYYQAHASSYHWKPSAAVVFFTILDPTQAQGFREQLIKNGIENWRRTASLYEGLVQADSGRFEFEQLPIQSTDPLKVGDLTPTKMSEDQTSAQFVWVKEIFSKTSPRTYTEARGYVLSDYQQYLEEKWIAQLKKKYPVRVNETVFNQLLR
jgi:peptidyl-prolyl cis-trans isomerase SurA